MHSSPEELCDEKLDDLQPRRKEALHQMNAYIRSKSILDENRLLMIISSSTPESCQRDSSESNFNQYQKPANFFLPAAYLKYIVFQEDIRSIANKDQTETDADFLESNEDQTETDADLLETNEDQPEKVVHTQAEVFSFVNALAATNYLVSSPPTPCSPTLLDLESKKRQSVQMTGG